LGEGTADPRTSKILFGNKGDKQRVIQWFLEPGNQQVLLAILIAFGIGLGVGGWWWHSSMQPSKSIHTKGDRAFFKGIQYIISNDRDHAIEEFTKSVQVNSDTIETYVALGNLYRSKGDIDRAIRIRQSIILRPNIDEQNKLAALFDLGLDYRKGGFFNRALKIFLDVARRDPSNVETLKEIESIYQELRDWENAYKIRQKIVRLTKGDHKNILAHYLVEIGKVAQEKGELSKANSFYNKAILTYRECVDAYLHLGDLHFAKEDYQSAISAWKNVAEVSPQFTFLAYGRLEGAYSKMKDIESVEALLTECAKSNSDAFSRLALARYLYRKKDIEGALKEITDVLQLAPFFWEARRLRGEILLREGREEEALSEYSEIIEYMEIPCRNFQCERCGFEPSTLQWQCPQCKMWDTIHLIDSAARPSASKDLFPGWRTS